MKKACFALLGLCFAGMASALTMGWRWTPIEKTLVEESSFYMVYSQNQAESVEQVVAAASGNKYGATTSATGSGWGSTLNTTDVKTSSLGSFDVAPNEGATVGAPVTGRPQEVSVTFVSGNKPMFDTDVTSGNGYLYFVIFNNVDVSKATQFAVGCIKEPDGITENGQVVGPSGKPLPVGFLPPVWLGGTHRAAPEPTALALLALGIAGVALRRRVR